MYNALFIASPAEGVPQDRLEGVLADLGEWCPALAGAWVAEICPEDSSTNAGCVFCELAFPDRASLEEAQERGEWASIDAALRDEATFGLCEYMAYGGGELKVTRDDCTCHRIMAVRLDPSAGEEGVEAMLERLMRVDEYVPGLANMQVAPVIESSGSGPWDYVYDCDFVDPADYLITYMSSPYHWGYLRLAQSDCVEYVMAAQLSPHVLTEESFLARI